MDENSNKPPTQGSQTPARKAGISVCTYDKLLDAAIALRILHEHGIRMCRNTFYCKIRAGSIIAFNYGTPERPRYKIRRSEVERYLSEGNLHK